MPHPGGSKPNAGNRLLSPISAATQTISPAKHHGFPSDDALLKLFYPALRNISQKWAMPIRDWKAAR